MTNNSCGCGHCDHDEEINEPLIDEDCACDCGHNHSHTQPASPEDLAKIKAAILQAGYKIEESPNGDIKILEK